VTLFSSLLASDEEEIEILNDIRTGIANLAAQDGETELTNELNNSLLHDYISVPANGDLLACPAGRLTVDFDNGEVTHTEISGNLTDDVKKLGNLSGRADKLRSFNLGIDAPAKMRLGGGDWVLVDPGVYNVAAQRFTSVEIQLDMPAAMNLMASTRSQPFVTGNITSTCSASGISTGPSTLTKPCRSIRVICLSTWISRRRRATPSRSSLTTLPKTPRSSWSTPERTR